MHEILERLSNTLRPTANGRNDHVTMFTLNLPLAVFSFSKKIEYFGVSIKGHNYLLLFSSMYSFFQENINANLTFAVSRKRGA